MGSGSGSTREAIALTQRSIDALRPAEAAYRVPDQRCTGLAVRVAPSGIKTWDLAYRIRNSGKTRRLSLGRVADVALEKARERANALTSAARGVTRRSTGGSSARLRNMATRVSAVKKGQGFERGVHGLHLLDQGGHLLKRPHIE